MTKYFYSVAVYSLFTLISCTEKPIESNGENPDPDPNPSVENTSKLWTQFVEGQEKNEPTLLLDFSYAGYRHGEVEPPKVTHKIFNVVDHGAIANDGKSDRAAVEAAIAAATANGSGIIFFPKGRYDLNGKDDNHNTSIEVAKGVSNIVFRGEGSGPGGTELYMEYPKNPTDPSKIYSCPPMIQIIGGHTAGHLANVTSNGARGTFSLEVDNTSGIAKDDWVRLFLKSNDPAVIEEELAPFADKVSSSTSIKTNGVEVVDYHQVVSISGNTITFKEPIMRKVDAKYNWTIVKYLHSEENGVEDIAFNCNWKTTHDHNENFKHVSGSNPLVLRSCVNSWVRRCRFIDVTEAVNIKMCANISVYDCVIEGNRGHAAVRSDGSSRVFIGAVEDKPSQWHSVGVSGTTLGTVIWQTKTGADSSFELHASQPRATLIDNCQSGFISNRGGGTVEAGPNHLRELIFWNFNQINEAYADWDFVKSGFIMMPIVVGWHGAATTFQVPTMQYNESNGKKVYPESLYEAQLGLRLGSVPAWLTALKK